MSEAASFLHSMYRSKMRRVIPVNHRISATYQNISLTNRVHLAGVALHALRTAKKLTVEEHSGNRKNNFSFRQLKTNPNTSHERQNTIAETKPVRDRINDQTRIRPELAVHFCLHPAQMTMTILALL